MGKFKDVGDPGAALAEESAELIQVINKLYRFGGNWDEVPEGKIQTRWEELVGEMEDVLYQWNRLVVERHHEDGTGAPLSKNVWGLIARFNNSL